MKNLIKLLVISALAAGLFAQSQAAPTCAYAYNSTPAAAGSPLYVGALAFPVTLTDGVYFAAQPPAVQTLMCMPQGAAKDAQALALANQGYTIDVQIMDVGWDPTLTMAMRWQYGYTWVPSALQAPISLPPGLSFPGLTPYDPKNPPAGSIKVSVNASDYPAFAPVIPPAPPATNLVGAELFGSVYTFGPGVTVGPTGVTGVTNQQQVVQDGATYTAIVSRGLIGWTVYFLKN